MFDIMKYFLMLWLNFGHNEVLFDDIANFVMPWRIF